MENKIKKPISESEIAKAVDIVKANFAIEGMALAPEAIALGQKYMRGEISSDNAMRELIENYGEDI